MPKSAIKNKDLAQDIARACKMPEKEARKTLDVLINCMARELKKNKELKIRNFGRFLLWRPKFTHLPDGRLVPAVKWRCEFVTKGALSILLKNKWFDTYCWTLARKYERQIKEGDIRGAKKTRKNLRKKLRGKWSMANWLAERGRLPYRLWKKRSDDV